MPGALERVVRQASARRAEAEEHCDLCGEPLFAEHRHLFDSDAREVMCACRPCSLLFDRDAASNGHYRQVPRRRKRLDPPVPTDSLGVPVGLAFFVPRDDGTVLAHYPSPAGPTQWEVDTQAWLDLAGHHAELRTLRGEVEALLVNTAHGERQSWVVPITDCFRLVAVVRQEWRGLSGGGTVWPAIDRFFAELVEQR
jgi:hypothetical protein